MLVVGFLSWWYGEGWKRHLRQIRERVASTFDYFSIGLLLKTLFSPFRQISAGKVRGSLAVQWRAFVDRLVSRCIGAIVRSILIVIGCVTIVLHIIFGCISAVIWAVVPLLPLVGIVLTFMEWLPWK